MFGTSWHILSLNICTNGLWPPLGEPHRACVILQAFKEGILMRELFEGSELLRRARKNGLGWNAIIEVIKFLLVIKAADSLTQRVAWAAYSHGLDRFVSRDVLWLLSIGLIGLVAIAYSLVWEHMRPADVGVRFSPAGKILRGLGCGFAAGAIVMGGVPIVLSTRTLALRFG